MRRLTVLSVLFAAGCAAETIEPTEPTFARAHGGAAASAHDLGPGTATDINVHGDVVGYAQAGGTTVAWLQDLSGARRFLPEPPRPLPPWFGCFTVAMAINDRREVAGSIQCGSAPTVESFAVIWSRNDAITVLGNVGEVTIPNSINNRGMVVGSSIFEAPAWGMGAWYWTAETGIRRILSIGINGEGTGAAVNQAGQIAGTYWTAPFPAVRAYTWSSRHTDQPVVLAPDDDSRGYAIDAQGRVGGTTAGRPAIWHPGSGWTVLPDLGFGGVVNGMSNNGVAVGTVGSEAGTRAAYWNVHGELTILDPLDGATASSAIAVNQRGWVVGHSWSPAPYGSRATLWTVGAPLPGRIARAAPQHARSSRVAQPFVLTAGCTEKWRHYVQAGGSCPEKWRGQRPATAASMP